MMMSDNFDGCLTRVIRGVLGYLIDELDVVADAEQIAELVRLTKKNPPDHRGVARWFVAIYGD